MIGVEGVLLIREIISLYPYLKDRGIMVRGY
jgi:hypothetical protein